MASAKGPGREGNDRVRGRAGEVDRPANAAKRYFRSDAIAIHPVPVSNMV